MRVAVECSFCVHVQWHECATFTTALRVFTTNTPLRLACRADESPRRRLLSQIFKELPWRNR
jgi:hypothetical protein